MAGRGDLIEELGHGQHQHRARVAQHVRQIGVAQAGVHRHGHRARLQRREPGQRPTRDVGQHDRNPVAGTGTGGSEPLRVRVDRGEAEPAVGEPEELAIAEPPGGPAHEITDGGPLRIDRGEVHRAGQHAPTDRSGRPT
jgi:hypothetical protein